MQKEKILVVDDEKNILEVFPIYLIFFEILSIFLTLDISSVSIYNFTRPPTLIYDTCDIS